MAVGVLVDGLLGVGVGVNMGVVTDAAVGVKSSRRVSEGSGSGARVATYEVLGPKEEKAEEGWKWMLGRERWR